ncbi:hypothetical protein Y032_0015g2641 [Ancylostoma ceylanicum]|uniref:Uncharacterized protein n=1 Tax=Ancylostoma ceylanicum TaxID=53326 RepID=A0A016V814_9BILA|nr:hypothetical protein Y032_0015g2641 [Ancylostoma ceylanicum]
MLPRFQAQRRVVFALPTISALSIIVWTSCAMIAKVTVDLHTYTKLADEPDCQHFIENKMFQLEVTVFHQRLLRRKFMEAVERRIHNREINNRREAREAGSLMAKVTTASGNENNAKEMVHECVKRAPVSYMWVKVTGQMRSFGMDD